MRATVFYDKKTADKIGIYAIAFLGDRESAKEKFVKYMDREDVPEVTSEYDSLEELLKAHQYTRVYIPERTTITSRKTGL